MTTETQNITSDWLNLNTALSLSDGIQYAVECVAPSEVYLREDTATPKRHEIGHMLARGDRHNEFFYYMAASGSQLYARSKDPQGSTLAITEA